MKFCISIIFFDRFTVSLITLSFPFSTILLVFMIYFAMNFTFRHKLLVPVSMVMKAYWVFHIKLKLVIDGRKNNLL